MPQVWIINKSNHDYSDALRFGELRFLSEGPISKANVADMSRQFCHRLSNSEPEDYLLLTSLSVMSSIASVEFVRRHGRLNLLLYQNGKYIERRLCYDASQSKHQGN